MNFRPVLLCLGMVCLAKAHAGEPRPKASEPVEGTDKVLPTPDYLPPLARAVLHKAMQRHGRDQSRLVLAVTLLQRNLVKSIASEIAAEPRLVRPLGEGRDELNSALPERFFVLQDSLRLRAKELAQAAEKKDDVGLARTFGQLVETCVSCHSAYLDQP